MRKNMTDKQLLLTMRLAVVFVTVCSVIFATMQASIYELVSQSSAISLVSLFVPLVGGLYWKRANNIGAITSMIIGFIVWLFIEILQAKDKGWAEAWHLDFPPIIYGLVASILGLFLGSVLTKK